MNDKCSQLFIPTYDKLLTRTIAILGRSSHKSGATHSRQSPRNFCGDRKKREKIEKFGYYCYGSDCDDKIH